MLCMSLSAYGGLRSCSAVTEHHAELGMWKEDKRTASMQRLSLYL